MNIRSTGRGTINPEIAEFQEAVIQYQLATEQGARVPAALNARLCGAARPVASFFGTYLAVRYEIDDTQRDDLIQEIWFRYITVLPRSYDRTKRLNQYALRFAFIAMYALRNEKKREQTVDFGDQEIRSRISEESLGFSIMRTSSNGDQFQDPNALSTSSSEDEILSTIDRAEVRERVRLGLEALPDDVDLVTGQVRRSPTLRRRATPGTGTQGRSHPEAGSGSSIELRSIWKLLGITLAEFSSKLEIPQERLLSYLKGRVKVIPVEIIDRAMALRAEHEALPAQTRSRRTWLAESRMDVLCKEWVARLGFSWDQVIQGGEQFWIFSSTIDVNPTTLRRWLRGENSSLARKTYLDRKIGLAPARMPATSSREIGAAKVRLHPVDPAHKSVDSDARLPFTA